MNKIIRHYIDELSFALKDLPIKEINEVVNILKSAQKYKRYVFVIGNGGSASTAMHIACDLSKNIKPPYLRAISLVDNIASLSAYANDNGYETVFSDQLKVYGNSKDVIIAISTSGISKNILSALDVANELGMVSTAFTSKRKSQIFEKVDVCVVAPTLDIRHAEDIHLMIDHIIVSALS